MKLSMWPSIKRKTASGNATAILNDVRKLQRGTRIIIWCRRSRCQKTGSAEEQAIYYRAIAHDLGLFVVAVIIIEQSGYDPWSLCHAIGRAERENATLVAATPNRFARSKHFMSNDSSRWKCQAHGEQWAELAWLAGEVHLATFCNPNATPEEEAAEHMRRSHAVKQPHHKRTLLQPIAIDLYKQRWSKRSIARYLGEGETTIRRWLDDI